MSVCYITETSGLHFVRQPASLYWVHKGNSGLVFFWRNQLITLAVNVDDFYLRIVFQVFTQLGDINVHRACIEIVVVNPDGLQCEITLQNLVGMAAKQAQKIVLLRSQLRHLVADGQGLLLGVEHKLTDVIDRTLLVFLATYTAQDGLDT